MYRWCKNYASSEYFLQAVELKVADLDNMIRYYTNALPLSVLDQQGSSAIIGRGKRPLVFLEHSPALKQASSSAAGWFHTAILFETETALAAALYSVAQYAQNTFSGSEWSWVHGQVEIDNLLLDPVR